jgi:hypothetical protein
MKPNARTRRFLLVQRVTTKLLDVSVCALVFFSINSAFAIDRPVFSSGFLASPPKEYKNNKKIDKISERLPPSVDLSSRMPPPGDQGQQGSCVAWAVAYAARSYYLGLEGVDLSNQIQLPSPAYIYNQINPNSLVGCDSGTLIPDALNVLKRQGVASMAEFPYNPLVCSKKPDQNVIAAARRNVISDWRAVRPSVAAIKAELYRGNPVIFGMMIDEAFQYHVGSKPYVNRSDAPSPDGHAMVIVGYDDLRNAFKIQNSWGSDWWGTSGRAWIDYETLRKRTGELYVMEVRSIAPPAPGPKNPENTPNPSPVSPDRPDNDVPKTTDIKEAANKIEVLTAGIDCGKITAKVDNWGIVRLEGFTGKAEQLLKLTNAIIKIKGVRHVENSVRVTPWPLCEVYLAMDSLPKPTRKIATTIVGRPDNVLVLGDSFSVEITMPKVPGYLYVVYLQSNGEAIKFHWAKPYTPGQTLTLGGAGYKVTAPTGKEMLLAVASSTPIWRQDVEDVTKPDKEFLTVLGEGLRNLPVEQRARLSFSAVEILTRRR